jgi:hypothetical protein
MLMRLNQQKKRLFHPVPSNRMMQKLQKIKEFVGSDNAEQILAADNTIAGIELAKALNLIRHR